MLCIRCRYVDASDLKYLEWGQSIGGREGGVNIRMVRHF